MSITLVTLIPFRLFKVRVKRKTTQVPTLFNSQFVMEEFPGRLYLSLPIAKEPRNGTDGPVKAQYIQDSDLYET